MWLAKEMLIDLIRYQRGNKKCYIKGQTAQWSKEKGQKEKECSKNTTQRN
jgi:hypothetical protein